MKKPQMMVETPHPASNEANFDALLEALSAVQLTALLKRVETLREEKLFAAKRDLVTEYRAKAAELGLDINELVKSGAFTAKSASRARGPTLPIPPDWENRIIQCLEKQDGRAPSYVIARAVYPEGGGSGSGNRLRSHLMEMVDRGILLLLRPGGVGSPPIYGLASMIEQDEVAAE